MRLSPSTAISLLALVISLGGAGYAATGGTFLLGRANTATTATTLTSPVPNGSALTVKNTSATGAAALSLFSAAGKPPLKVNRTVKVTNLNADYLDGLDFTQFARTARVSYNLAPGANSAPITLPANRPVFFMAVTTGGGIGVAQATLLRIPGGAIGVIGLNSPNLNNVSGGFSISPGARLLYLDIDQLIELQRNSDGTIRIHNGHIATVAGKVTLIW